MLAQYVVKVSKFCNLRCSYCYEYPELGNPDRMSIEQLDGMFAQLAAHYRAAPNHEGIRFIWHGGEPLLQPPAYYREIFAAQKRHFGDREIDNSVQTNLMVLDDERIELLRNGFNGIGVSIDLFGDLRVNVAGKPSQGKVLENMGRLQDAGIMFGCITVLNRRNLAHVDQIFRFYETLGCSFRLLPLFRGATEDQHLGFDVTGQEVLTALCRVADLWLASVTRLHIAPITDQLRHLVQRRSRFFEPRYYDRRSREEVILVNTNGDLYSQADAYTPGRAWGNVFQSPFADILRSQAHDRSVLDAETRMAGACLQCEYFGACDGFDIAEDNRRYQDATRGGRTSCIVERGLYLHLERRLREAEAKFGPTIWDRLEKRAEEPGAEQPAIGWMDIPVQATAT